MIRRVTIWVTNDAGIEVVAGDISVFNTGDFTHADFRYDPAFMYDDHGFDLAPGWPRAAGEIATKGLPLFVEDAGPDRWGTLLLRRAASQNGAPRPDRWDCIVGADDHARQGALRLADDREGWLSGSAIPQQVPLADLLRAAGHVEADDEVFSAYADLLGTGTSALGGARAKASVTDEHGRLWIAKFPMSSDTWNVPVWEKAALDLAERAGIPAPRSQLLKVSGREVLLVERFDRRSDSTRIPYLSMRSLLRNPDDGSLGQPDYRDIAVAMRHVNGGADLALLFRRTAFSVAINNTDDHLRNMGLLRLDGEWRLSPAFDLNPEPDAGRPRHTAILGRSTHLGVVVGLMELGRYCGLNQRQTADVLDDLRGLPTQLLDIAGSYGASEREVARFRRELAVVASQSAAG